MSQVFVSLGSNIDRQVNTRKGVSALHHAYGELLLSSVYESIAVGFDGDAFYNMVIGFETQDAVDSVARHLRQIEQDNGRQRSSMKFSSRTLDLDLLLYDDLVIEDGRLEVPRHEILKYSFVLWPLAEVAPHLRHPVNGETYEALWADFVGSREGIQAIPFEF